MTAYKKITIGTFRAEVLNEKKEILFSFEDGSTFHMGVDPDLRVTGAMIGKLVSERSKPVKTVHVYHSRYARYNYRSVMSTRSGRYEQSTKFLPVDGKWVSQGRKTQNGMY